MGFKVWLKSRAADRVLAPLRWELIELIEQDAAVVEIGCGTGDLLLKAAPRINRGYGVDVDRKMIDYAEQRRRDAGFDHLRFECIDALKISHQKYDVATSTLCLHELSESNACELLGVMANLSKEVLIADYREADGLFGKVGIEIDELFSGHYRNYRRYRKRGEIPHIAESAGLLVEQKIDSVIDGISIWRIRKPAR